MSHGWYSSRSPQSVYSYSPAQYCRIESSWLPLGPSAVNGCDVRPRCLTYPRDGVSILPNPFIYQQNQLLLGLADKTRVIPLALHIIAIGRTAGRSQIVQRTVSEVIIGVALRPGAVYGIRKRNSQVGASSNPRPPQSHQMKGCSSPL